MELSSYDQASIASALQNRYALFLAQETFSVSGESDQSVAALTITLAKRDQSKRHDIFGRFFFAENPTKTPQEAFDLLLDLIDGYLKEHFESDRDVHLPLNWTGFVFQACTIQLREEEMRPLLDQEADRLLGDADSE